MSLSKSIHEGQIPISCQLCEESNEIKWKCLQCDFLLCTKCQKIHKKVKSTYQHTIIDIKDIASHKKQTKDKLDFSNIPCGIHSDQNCCIFCQTCDEVVCPSCIANTHTKHNMIELVEGYKTTAKKIDTFSSELDIKLANNKRGRSKLSSFKSSEDFKYERERQNILIREKKLKKEVEMHTNNLLKEIDQSWKLQTKSVADADIKSQTINKDLVFRRTSLINALASVNTCNVFSAYKEEIKARKQRIEEDKTHFKRLPQYVPGKIHIQQELHGELITSTNEYSPEQYEATMISQYKTGLNNVEYLKCCDDGTLWIGHNRSNIIQKIQFSNQLLKVVHEVHVDLVGVELLPSGDLLISTAEPDLKILSNTTGKITHSKYSVAPLITGAIHVTGDDKIIVRARKKGPVFPVKGTRQVVVMNIEGRKEKVYELDNNGKHIFSAPQRITTDTDNNIYVLDRQDVNNKGRIMRLNTTNGASWIHSGNPDTNKNNTFKPRDLVATKSDKIIVTEYETNLIHILNNSGQCIHYLNTGDQLEIQEPNSLDIDNIGTLYIGCGMVGNLKNTAKIYTIQLSGF